MAAKKKSTKTKSKSTANGAGGGRGSKEAIAKRRTARQLNTLLLGGTRATDKLDGRTEKRRQRLVKELKDGKGGKALKPIDLVTHVNELLEIGETLGSLRKQGVKARKTELTPHVLEVAKTTQDAYSFRPEAWKMLGIDLGKKVPSAAAPQTQAKKASKSRKPRAKKTGPRKSSKRAG